MKLELSEKQISIFAVVSIILIGGFIYWLMNDSTNAERLNREVCTTIEVNLTEESEEPLVSIEQIEEFVNNLGVIDSTMNKIDIDSVKEKLQAKGLFRELEVYKVNASLCLDLSLKEVFFLVQPENGESYYVARERVKTSQEDSTGLILSGEERYSPVENVIPFDSSYKPVQVPLITGAVTKEYAVTQIYDLLKTLEEDPYYKDYFAHIYMDKEQGLMLRPKVCDTDIIFGYATNWKEMLHKLNVFEEEVIQRKGWDSFEYLKFNFQNQVIAKAKK